MKLARPICLVRLHAQNSWGATSGAFTILAFPEDLMPLEMAKKTHTHATKRAIMSSRRTAPSLLMPELRDRTRLLQEKHTVKKLRQ